ncbi:vestitone reductase-like [Andrographis paniculata]|uniref:vestitone reductase-like n=1 Tax=Andrographis paniculata TaxID=175694 RepID=UPI0021E85414|nr:vestitone reductase-like [Andrographis paniculata]
MADVKSGESVCVTGGTGFLATTLITNLLRNGYSVNTTIRYRESKTDLIRDLRNIPGASDRLRIFEADLRKPEDFAPAVAGCAGVFHVAHPMGGGEDEKKTAVGGVLGILEACVAAGTVRRFVYTGSATAVVFGGGDSDKVDEESWTDFEHVRSLGLGGAGESYAVIKTVAERAALEFGERRGMDVVTVVPTWVLGPFAGRRCPYSVQTALSLILGNEESYRLIGRTSFVHVEDVARAHVHLFEHPNARGRYICSSVDITLDTLAQFMSTRYPQYKLPNPNSWKNIIPVEKSVLSSKKLLETGFEYQHGLQEMFDEIIHQCQEIGYL